MKVLLTGYPGFIGGRVVARLAERNPEATFVLLVQERMHDEARRRLDAAGLSGRAELAGGDLVRQGLGLDAAVLRGVTDVWHLAAIYDLSVPEGIAREVNVQGTKHVLDVCETLPELRRLMYFSTCYVAGRTTGLVREDDLDPGRRFHNHYESTKCYAEVEVRKRVARLPITVVRPAAVVGDSRTGETDKYDGPYYIFKTMLHAPKWIPLPMVGRGTAKLNIVPVDYIVEGSVALSELDEAQGVTCQLADPAPLPIRVLLDEVARICGRRGPVGWLPVGPTSALARSQRVRRALGIPREVVAYTSYPVEFDTRNARRLLEPRGVRCPPVTSYLPTLLDYVRHNPDKDFLDGRRL